MSQDLLSLLASWNGNGVVVRHDQPTGCWMFIALHDHTLGAPTGGTRMKVYPTPTEGLRDALRLAEGMTSKWAGLGLRQGGGKAVLALTEPLSESACKPLWERYGTLVESLDGAFLTGADLGMSADAMAVVGRRTKHVLGIDYSDGSSRDPGPFTSHGVLKGLEAALGHVFGNSDVAGRRVIVEGIGGVGEPLARSLAADGAHVLLSDLDAEKARRLAAELDSEFVPLSNVSTTACDVYSPCAIGATLNPQTIPHLACRIVAGSANNQLLTSEDAEALHRRGILYVPDYILNAGGAMAFILIHQGLNDVAKVKHRVEEIGSTVAEILSEAASAKTSPLTAATKRVARQLENARSGELDGEGRQKIDRAGI
jgi:leucine dehydrogenase